MDKTYRAINGEIRIHDEGLNINVTSRSEQLIYGEITKVDYKKATAKNEGTLDIYSKVKENWRLRFNVGDNEGFAEAKDCILLGIKGIKRNKINKMEQVTTKNENDYPESLKSYAVLYLGGVEQNPKKTYNIKLIILKDKFVIKSKLKSDKNTFYDFSIPYNSIINFEIVERNVTTFEGLLGGINSRQLNQNNNIHIIYKNEVGEERIVRLEMIDGITVMGQAAKCRELMDFLRINNILSCFKANKVVNSNIEAGSSYLAELHELGKLKENGIITQEEFDAKKKQLLGL